MCRPAPAAIRLRPPVGTARHGRILVGIIAHFGNPETGLFLPRLQREMRTHPAPHAGRIRGRRQSAVACCPRGGSPVGNCLGGPVDCRSQQTRRHVERTRQNRTGIHRPMGTGAIPGQPHRPPPGHGDLRVIAHRQNPYRLPATSGDVQATRHPKALCRLAGRHSRTTGRNHRPPPLP